MGRSLKIGSAFGIGLYLHWTFLLILALVFVGSLGGGLDSALLSTGFVFALFGCVVLHELGHALMARKFGIGTRDITLYPIGGVARLERMSDDPKEEIAIAVAGPAVNVVIAAGLWLGMSLAGFAPQVTLFGFQDASFGSVVEAALSTMFNVNLALVLFNLIPAFPMDGGRVLRAVLALGVGRLRATAMAVQVARLLAFAFILSGIMGRIPGTEWAVSPFLAIIGFFVLIAGRQELAMLQYQEYARRHGRPQTPPTPPQEPVTVLPVDHLEPSAYPAQPGFSGFTWDRRAGVWIEWRDGRPVGACSVGRAGPAW